MASALTENYGNTALRIYAAVIDGLLDAVGNEHISAEEMAATLAEIQGRLHEEADEKAE